MLKQKICMTKRFVFLIDGCGCNINSDFYVNTRRKVISKKNDNPNETLQLSLLG